MQPSSEVGIQLQQIADSVVDFDQVYLTVR